MSSSNTPPAYSTPVPTRTTPSSYGPANDPTKEVLAQAAALIAPIAADHPIWPNLRPTQQNPVDGGVVR